MLEGTHQGARGQIGAGCDGIAQAETEPLARGSEDMAEILKIERAARHHIAQRRVLKPALPVLALRVIEEKRVLSEIGSCR